MDALKLDMATTALVLIDLQNGIVAMPTQPHSGPDVLARAAKLADRFRRAGATVVLVRVTSSADGKDALAPLTDAPAASLARPPDWATLAAELGPKDRDIVITKRQWGAFHGTELDLQLRRRGIRTLVLGGIATHIGVESTARDAYELGYDQVFVEDAMGAVPGEAHAASLKFIMPRMGRIRSTDEILVAIG